MKAFILVAKTCVIIFAVLTVFKSSFGELATWDVSADYSSTANPALPVLGGVWSYGKLNYGPKGLNDTPVLSSYVLYGVVDTVPVHSWQDGVNTIDDGGGVTYNNIDRFHSQAGIDWEPLDIDLVPDQPARVVSTVRLQVPSDGLYTIHAEFADNQSCCAGRESDAWVLTDSVNAGPELFHESKLPSSDGLLSHVSPTDRKFVIYDRLLGMFADESIYFASGKGPSGGDHVLLRAVVQQTLSPTEFEWKNDISGTWDDLANWDPLLIPGVVTAFTAAPEDVTVVFGDVIQTGQTVFTNSGKTLNSIQFDNANTYAIAGIGSISLAADSESSLPNIGVAQGSHQFQLGVSLNDDATADIASDSKLEFNNRLNLNGHVLTKNVF